MDYTIGYCIFGGLFGAAIIGYWVVTRSLRHPEATSAREPG
jgi:hypothetical protein